MHRLWSDTPWLKYYLAHGCYWRRCSFCDTELDYVADFARADVGAVMAAATIAAERTGLYGIHFVDEALPMAALLEFARANRAKAAGADVGNGGGIAATPGAAPSHSGATSASMLPGPRAAASSWRHRAWWPSRRASKSPPPAASR